MDTGSVENGNSTIQQFNNSTIQYLSFFDTFSAMELAVTHRQFVWLANTTPVRTELVL
jgi:hypothetical protein